MDHYAVFGNPIEHSLSPQIHQLFAQQTQQSIAYDKILVPLDDFKDSVDAFIQSGGQGANVTLPFKVQAVKLCHALSTAAQQAGAVNTLLFHDGQIEGHNTDGVGLIYDLRNSYQLSLKDKRVLVIGAGGAVRGIVPALVGAGVQSLAIANRTLEKAQMLADVFSHLGEIKAYDLNTLRDNYAIVIHATSVRQQLGVSLPSSILHPEGFYYDLNYKLDGQTPFLQWVSQHGCRQIGDGLGMLVEQAAEAFLLWRGVRPDTSIVKQQIILSSRA